MNHLLTLADAVATHARLSPNKLGARDSHRELSFAQWHERATRLARRWISAGRACGRRSARPVAASRCAGPSALITCGWPMPCSSGSATRYCTESAGRPSLDKRHCVWLRSVRRMALNTGTFSRVSAVLTAPWMFYCTPDAPLAEKIDGLRRFRVDNGLD